MKIVAAAIKDKTGTVYSLQPPNRHHDIIWQCGVAGHDGSVQGFLTDEGKFVDREEAMVIARAANQLIDRPAGPASGNQSTKLFSEDLWEGPAGRDWSKVTYERTGPGQTIKDYPPVWPEDVS